MNTNNSAKISNSSGKGYKAKSLGDYILIKNMIGKGSFAEVFEGFHKKNNTPVAIKVITRSKLNEKLMASLEQEINIMRKIDHENIIRLYAVHRSKRHFYLVMERCFGGELSTFMNTNKRPLIEVVAKKYLQDLAQGLKCMCEMNLVHRDLKPANLLLDIVSTIDPINPISKLGTLKIADFGFAREINPGALAETLCGSPLYMAPEILEAKKYDAKADLWSVGTILYEMLYGRPPYLAANMLDLIHKIKQGPPKYVSSTVTVNPLAVELLTGLLQADPDKRMSFEQFYNHPYLGLSHTSRPVPIPTYNAAAGNIKESAGIQQSSPSPPQEKTNTILTPSPSNKSIIRAPKTSPFVGGTNLEYSQSTAGGTTFGSTNDSFIMVDNMSSDKAKLNLSSLSSMITMTNSGHINYPNVIFDFSQYKCGNDQLQLLQQIEEKCKRVWAIAEAAYLMDRYNKQIEALCLYTRALGLLYDIFKKDTSKLSETSSERLSVIIMWIRTRYAELMEWAERVSMKLRSSQLSSSVSNTNSSLVTTCAEDILYKYALKLAKESAYNEYLSDQSKCVNMYMRSKLIFEYLLYQAENMSKQDQQMLSAYIQQFDKRIKHAAGKN
jgi:serine/threonine-protein kinase ULK/ATG1